MKKILLLMAIVLPYVLISCDNKKDEPVTPEEHEYVDLGLPSGTLWATCNVGANAPEEYGDYFAWGETAPKEVYSWETYKWCKGSHDTMTKYCTQNDFGFNGFTDGKTELDPNDDAATANWGSSARMPSIEQIQELMESCTWKWTTRNGVYGELGTGPNGNTIFLPAASERHNDSFGTPGHNGYYWSRSSYSKHVQGAYFLFFYQFGMYCDGDERFLGRTVRAVRVP